MEQKINYIDMTATQPKKKPAWKKGWVIFLIILLVLVLLGCLVHFGLKGTKANQGIGPNGSIDISGDYIGELYIEGTIAESSSSSLLGESSEYQHQWTLNRIDEMMEDSNNKGILFYVNTPGGTVYASDELYFKIKEYKEKTGRPVYSYMASQATSGGYYISAPCDKIIANRNCWTGSIGVTIGTIYDVTGLLEKYGVKTQTITSGKNKAMGSSAVKMTKEQKEIFQSLVDDAYDQFVDIVAEGRKMPLTTVKKLADGRVYTAKQAKRLNLIDQIASHEDAIQIMQKENNISAKVSPIVYKKEESLFTDLLGIASSLQKSEATDPLSQLSNAIGSNGKISISYESAIKK